MRSSFFLLCSVLFVAVGVVVPLTFLRAADAQCVYPCGTQENRTKVSSPIEFLVKEISGVGCYDWSITNSVTLKTDTPKTSKNFVVHPLSKGDYSWTVFLYESYKDDGTCGGGYLGTGDRTWYFTVLSEGTVIIRNPLQTESFTGVVDKILNIIFFVAIAVAPVMIIVAGFKFLTGGGNPETLQGARQMLVWTAVGFGIILLSKGIVLILRNVIGF